MRSPVPLSACQARVSAAAPKAPARLWTARTGPASGWAAPCKGEDAAGYSCKDEQRRMARREWCWRAHGAVTRRVNLIEAANVGAHADLPKPESGQLRLLVQCLMLDATNKTDGFLVWARRKPQRYRVVSRGFATPPRPKRRGFMSQIASNTALGNH